MARYDRIAPLTPPARDNAFPGWWVLRDLEGIDRDVELARRARLRFLALRPVRRLLDRGPANVSRESYLSQIETVREELGYLPARDGERARLARFLHQIEDGDPTHVTSATLEMADGCASAGQVYGAEEFAMTALGLGENLTDKRLAGVANATLSRVYRMRGQTKEAIEAARAAVAAAEASGNHADGVRAKFELAMSTVASGDADEARKIAVAATTGASDQVNALAEARLSAFDLATGDPAAALEHGVPALRRLDDLRERANLLETLGRSFAMLGLHKAAERCFTIVAQRGVDPSLRARARAAQALSAALTGGVQAFHDRRAALLNDSTEWSADPRVVSLVHLELGRGCMLVRDVDDAREHLRAALATARKHQLPDILAQTEGVLVALEKNATEQLIGVIPPLADTTRRIAEQFESLPDLPVIAN